MLVGDFMIDDTNYADCLALYNFNHVDKIKGKESFSYIFNDNINYIRSLYNRGKIRNVTYDTIQKTILCGFIYLGYDLFVCPHCGNESIVPHKCHSKLCTSCGSKEAKLRAVHIFSIALDAKHRHIVFTIPDLLREYIDDAVNALEISLTNEDLTYLEEMYVPHPIIGAINENQPQGTVLLDKK